MIAPYTTVTTHFTLRENDTTAVGQLWRLVFPSCTVFEFLAPLTLLLFIRCSYMTDVVAVVDSLPDVLMFSRIRHAPMLLSASPILLYIYIHTLFFSKHDDDVHPLCFFPKKFLKINIFSTIILSLVHSETFTPLIWFLSQEVVD